MREEGEIMDEVHGLNGEIKSFPPGSHWLCPKRSDDDPVEYEDPDEPEEDMSAETKRETIEDGRKRYNITYKFSIVLGLDHDIAGELLAAHFNHLDSLFEVCDKCVRNWHKGRKSYLKDLAEQYDETVVTALGDRLNSLDVARIHKGLKSAQDILMEVEPTKRNQGILAVKDPAALMAVFEALCCVDYHTSASKLAKHFDFVFSAVQTKKVLRIRDVLPAMATFLFDPIFMRNSFAKNAWEKMENNLTPALFQWVVHDALADAMFNVNQPYVRAEEVRIFWQGFLLMLARMDEDMITHSLRAMEVQPDIYHLILNHLSSDDAGVVELVIKAFRQLLVKSPKDFWGAMTTIGPHTVAEQVFTSRAFDKMVMSATRFEEARKLPAFTWMLTFITSLPMVHQTDACRSLLHHLLQRLQDGKYSEHTRLASCLAGLEVLHATIDTYLKSEYTVNPTTSLIAINDLMGIVSNNKDVIVGCADLPDTDNSAHAELKRLGMSVIRDALALDCKAINAEWQALDKDQPVHRVTRAHSQSVWQAVLDVFRPGNLELAKNILAATSILIGLDKLLPAHKKQPLSKDHAQFNKDFDELNDNVSRVYERLSDFSSDQLRHLARDLTTARPLFGSLLSADQAVCQAAVACMKTMAANGDNDTVDKQEALHSVLRDRVMFSTYLTSIAYAESMMRRHRTFTPVEHMLALGKQTIDTLCGTTGVLRSRTTMTAQERIALQGWWIVQWRFLDSTFKNTEHWATRVNRPTAALQDFCRDAIDYAESLFDKYSVVASACRGSRSDSDKLDESTEVGSSRESSTKVLNAICRNLLGLTGMLRLRDVYLLRVTTQLLTKLLRVLGELDLEIDEEAMKYIQGACRREDDQTFKRTNLSLQQKAELQRVLDEHYGVQIIEPPLMSVQKQSTIDSWSNSAGGERHEPTLPVKQPIIVSSFAKTLAVSNKVREMREASNAKRAVAIQSAGFQSDKNFKENRRLVEEETKRAKAEAIAKARALRTPASLVKGEGSGLQGISGVIGKDHAPMRNEIMVGTSDEDSDEEDDDDDDPNALLKKGNRTSKQVAEYEKSKRAQMLKAQQQGPVRKTKIQRSAKDLRARVEPNMDNLYLEILNWDIFHAGDKPPSHNEYRKIDNRYIDLDLYKKTFGPLLISEVWRSLATAKDENNYKPIKIKVLNRLSVDKFMEVSTSMPMALNKDLKISERDIVLLSRGSDPLNEPDEPHCLARVDRTTRKKEIIEVTYRISRDVNAGLLQCLAPNGEINALKIADMTTTQREFAALSSLEYYDLCNEVLEAKPSPIQFYSQDKLANISTKYHLNRGQANAILSANENDGFTLIQGPPGSGKTKTIVAMIGSLLTTVLQQQVETKVLQPTQGPNAGRVAPAPKKKLLICAPSNAAVDELVVRLMEGVKPLNGPLRKINVIRIGRSEAINDGVKAVMLDELVRKQLERDTGENNKLIQDRDKLHEEAGKIKERLNVIRPQMDTCRATQNKTEELNLQREFDSLKRKQAQIGSQIDAEKQCGNTMGRQNEINRRKYQQEIIDGAHVLCATLSGSGHDMFRNLNVEFETVIIDEAAQCIELSALIPLKYGCSKCILVGDPEQLPPTVLSRSAQSFGYEQSLFVRMQKNHPRDIHLLDTQYRMHPDISSFPSQQFYQGRLVDGDGMAKLRIKPWHRSSVFSPYRFFDVEGIQTKEARGHSFINIPELNAALRLYARLKADYSSYDFKGKIGIITSYKAQLNELKSRFARTYGEVVFEEIEFNTTDAFQGREREIIIFSCVRAKATGGIGFLGDIRRMNVGLTRAKSSLWVLGDSRSLQQGEFWNKLIQDAKKRNRYTGGDVMGLFSRPTIQDVPEYEDDNDVEMADSISVSSSSRATDDSRSASGTGRGSGSATPAGASIAIARQPIQIPDRTPAMSSGTVANSDAQTLVKPKAVTQNLLGINKPVAKRPRDPVKEDVEAAPPTKKLQSATKGTTASDLEAAHAAKQAAKSAPPLPGPSAGGSRPPGPYPPRKKAPVDPFIQKKKPVRRG
ncbi:SEN1 N terminal-domain-containing protein [Calycina marina]|uniref:SEN1 N terminal-domain-containing protein n=1 Tax=Calycina marina TaxID=1763456 RepID=A0A9P8CIN8_9HELO|nr:SEN1 N terminal-domain-containing protein [Calycina marina]